MGDLGPTTRIREVQDLRQALIDAAAAARAHADERERAVAAVAAERQRFYDVLETLPVYVVLLSPDYHVPFANRFFRERFGESARPALLRVPVPAHRAVRELRDATRC